MRKLNVSDNQLSGLFSGDMTWATDLNTLVATRNHITQFPNVSSLHELVTITLPANDISYINPDCLLDLPKLTIFVFWGNDLEGTFSLPGLPSLENLHFGGNKVSRFISMGPLPKLKLFNFPFNNFEEWPDLSSFTTLEQIAMHSNPLGHLNDDIIVDLPNLWSLRLSGKLCNVCHDQLATCMLVMFIFSNMAYWCKPFSYALDCWDVAIELVLLSQHRMAATILPYC